MLDILQRAFYVAFKEQRLPYSWSNKLQRTLYQKQLIDTLEAAACTAPIACSPDATTELHLVTCKRDVYMAILAIKSLLRFVPKLMVVIHGDESLDNESISVIRTSIPGCRTISYANAESVAKKHTNISALRSKLPELFQLDSQFERQKRAWALKIFDFHIHSESSKVIVLDSDTLFLREPVEIANWITSASSTAFYSIPVIPNLRVDEALYKNAFPRAKIIKSFNGGLFGFDKRNLPLSTLVEIAETLLDHPEIKIYGDECVWRFAFGHIDSQHLPYETYPLFATKMRYKEYSKFQQQFKYIHFLLKHNHGFYNKHAKKVLEELP